MRVDDPSDIPPADLKPAETTSPYDPGISPGGFAECSQLSALSEEESMAIGMEDEVTELNRQRYATLHARALHIMIIVVFVVALEASVTADNEQRSAQSLSPLHDKNFALTNTYVLSLISLIAGCCTTASLPAHPPALRQRLATLHPHVPRHTHP